MVVVPEKHFRLILMFVGKARSLPKMKHLKGMHVAALLSNNRPGWKGLPKTYTLA
jgi:hypothetical protein